ncbi:MAG: ABC transporter permease [Candidatus Heimdallarchaeota archaeon]|nr:ABC transporter permease [Candidatus Heimdallarchaeota archaeon]MCG3255924.1 ABC transporter permease [Candidatus Heimdallarchaeota archaeon]MCK4610995.1 ABC transporter permease [Candidatus Heimdallarchaeota archaeon]
MALSYKSSYLMTFFLNLITIVMYFFFGKMNPDMTVFGIPSTYLEFCFLGLCLQMIIGTSLATVCGSIYNEIVSGTWSYLLFQFNFIEYSIGSTLAGVVLSSLSVFAALFLAYLFMGSFYVISIQEVMLVIVLFMLILIAHMSISMIFASFTIYYQKNSGLVPLLYQLTKTFTGIVFPLSLLKGFSMIVSRALPLTYGLEALHSVVLTDQTNWQLILTNSMILLISSIVIGVFAIFLASKSIAHSKKHNKVDWY